MSLALSFACPRCLHAYEDAWEVLDGDICHKIHCEHCHQPFVALLKECISCEEESSYVWNAEPGEAELASLTCGHCHEFQNGIVTVDACDVEPLLRADRRQLRA
jgi:hypothetical protein